MHPQPVQLETRRLLAAALCGAAVLMLAGVAVSWGLADYRARKPIERIAYWNVRGEVAPLDDWVAVRDSLLGASRLDPSNPLYSEWLGLAHASRVRVAVGGDTFYELALDYYRSAAAKRPTSAFTWANIALTKYRLGALDTELYAALVNAAQLGPWEPKVQFTVVDLGLALWDELPAASRHLVTAQIRNGLKRHANEMLAIGVKRGRQDVICGLAATHKFLRDNCQ